MPKYLLLKHYTGGPERHPDFTPMSKRPECAAGDRHESA